MLSICAASTGVTIALPLLPRSSDNTYAIHDYEGFGGVRISQSEGLVEVAALAAFIIEHGALGAALIDYYGGDLDEAREAMTERYVGSYASLADYVQEVTEDTTTIPEALRCYIDWQAMARDAEMSGDLSSIETGYGEVHIFAAR